MWKFQMGDLRIIHHLTIRLTGPARKWDDWQLAAEAAFSREQMIEEKLMASVINNNDNKILIVINFRSLSNKYSLCKESVVGWISEIDLLLLLLLPDRAFY